MKMNKDWGFCCNTFRETCSYIAVLEKKVIKKEATLEEKKKSNKTMKRKLEQKEMKRRRKKRKTIDEDVGRIWDCYNLHEGARWGS